MAAIYFHKSKNKDQKELLEKKFIVKLGCVRSGQWGRRPRVVPLARLECHGRPRRIENAPSLYERTVTNPSISTQLWNAVPGPNRKERGKGQKTASGDDFQREKMCQKAKK